jgi:hypothetical protein
MESNEQPEPDIAWLLKYTPEAALRAICVEMDDHVRAIATYAQEILNQASTDLTKQPDPPALTNIRYLADLIWQSSSEMKSIVRTGYAYVRARSAKPTDATPPED